MLLLIFPLRSSHGYVLGRSYASASAVGGCDRGCVGRHSIVVRVRIRIE